MMKSLIVLGIVIIAIVAIYTYNYAFENGGFTSLTNQVQQTVQNAAKPAEAEIKTSAQKVDYTIEVFAEDLYVPWSIVFTSSERMLFTERNGKVREISNGILNPQPVLELDDISERSEEGLMGMVLHPDYETNKLLYLAYAYPKNGGLAVRVEQYKDGGTSLSAEKIIIDNLPAATNHAGTRLRFGPDGKLYITTGDATNRNIAQQMNSLGGKILRLNDDGTIPSDNPFSNSPIFSLGHRNPQGISFHPETGDLWETEHGPSTFDGPPGGDEVNLISGGKNYGWPEVSHEETNPRFESPKIVYTPAVAPASGMFYSGKMFPQFKNNFFFGGLKGEGIFRVILDSLNPREVVTHEKLPDINYGRIRDIAEGPDGSIYFSTSNQDGRGNARQGDDKIYRIVKK